VRIVQAWDKATAPTTDLELEAVAWSANGPAASMSVALSALPGSVQLTPADSTAACMRFADLVLAGEIVHAGDPLLDDQLGGAGKARTGDRWSFTRRGAGHVDAVYAVAHAVRGLEAAPKASPVWDGPLCF